MNARDANESTASRFQKFRETLEADFHGAPHNAIGGWVEWGPGEGPPGGFPPKYQGNMSSMASPYDPVFYAHHAFVDRIWSKWQDANINFENRHFMDAFEGVHERDNSAASLIFTRALRNNDDHENVSSADFEVSMHMMDDNPDTDDILETACVKYQEQRSNPHCANWQEIQCCLNKVVHNNALTSIPRIKLNDDSSMDICSPVNGNQFANSQMWLKNLESMGMITHEKVQNMMNHAHQDFLKAENALPEATLHDKADVSECDLSLCINTTQLLTVCQNSNWENIC